MNMQELIDLIGEQPEDSNEQAKGLLNEANDATATDRCCQYGEAEVNLSMQGELQQVVARCIKLRADKGMKPLHPGVVGSLNSIMIKVARIISAPEIKRDTIVDAIGYMITLFRCDLADRNKRKPQRDGTYRILGSSWGTDSKGHNWVKTRYVDPDTVTNNPNYAQTIFDIVNGRYDVASMWANTDWNWKKLPSVTFTSDTGDNYKIYLNVNDDGELNPQQPYLYRRVSDTNEN